MWKNFWVLFLQLASNFTYGLSISWPTATSPIAKDAPLGIDGCIQPTESGRLESGKFGFVRENGTRFHEGIDIKSFEKTENNVPADKIYAFMDGKVAYANRSPGASSYGSYVVVEHEHFLTLYAHLASVDVVVGQAVKAGEKIGILGTTSNCANIPNARAHVHFEIDFRIGDAHTFAKWYGENFGDKNAHGTFNGINLVGIDPIAAIEKWLKGTKPADFFVGEREAATIQIASTHVPSFVERYAPLVARGIDLTKPVKGWRIEFSWFGLPQKWTPLSAIDPKDPPLKLVSYRKSQKHNALLREVLREEETGIAIGPRLINTLKKMGFDVK
ncbi:MAG: M23 family metallopeptidase [Puniceicoccales bacterium]|jgi:murein DD-endopeptidase MepM/ murein hydrolase activator NlpD|nr:M23 family metallopeptidase [Puniceicoccales bacterium]